MRVLELRQGSVDKFRAVYEANSDDGPSGYQSLDRRAHGRARPQRSSNELDNYRSLNRPKQHQQQQQNRVL